MGWTPPSTSMPMDSGAGAYGAGGYGMQGQMAGGPAPVADPGMNYAGGDGGYVGDGGGYEGDCGGECCGGCGHHCGCCARLGMLCRCCCVPLCTTGDMVQHMPFFGTTHGYYYFRPYHVMHVFSQQELATRWGGDPRNPYDNTMFHRIYEQMGVEAKTKAPPGTAPMQPGAEYLGPGQAVTPTPVPMYESPSQSYIPSPSNGLPVSPLPSVESIPPPTR
jgi:hypothetical protein